MTVPTYNDELRPWWGKLRVGVQYLLAGTGPLAKSINHGGGFFRTSPELARPNMQLYFQAFSTLLPKAGERPLLTPDPFSGMSLGLSNCRPTSRGHIRICSADALAHPAITANAFSTDHDVTEMLAAVKYLRHLAAQPPLARLIAEELRPGPACQSDDALIEDFRKRSGTVYHPCCTARMGPDPATSVVDARLRVHGMQRSAGNRCLKLSQSDRGKYQCPLGPDGLEGRAEDPRRPALSPFSVQKYPRRRLRPCRESRPWGHRAPAAGLIPIAALSFPARKTFVFFQHVQIHVVAHVALGCLLQRLVIPRVIIAAAQRLVNHPSAGLRLANFGVIARQIPTRLRFRPQGGQRAGMAGVRGKVESAHRGRFACRTASRGRPDSGCISSGHSAGRPGA